MPSDKSSSDTIRKALEIDLWIGCVRSDSIHTAGLEGDKEAWEVF